jgi:hypothetical protein
MLLDQQAALWQHAPVGVVERCQSHILAIIDACSFLRHVEVSAWQFAVTVV